MENPDIEINAKDNDGNTALDYARKYGYNQIVQLLCPKAEGCIPLLDAAMVGDEKVVWNLINEGVDVNSKDRTGKTALIWAARYGHAKVAKILLENSDINVKEKDEDGTTALILAAMYGHENVTRLLLENLANVNAKVGSE